MASRSAQNPELADGGTFYDFTITRDAFRYASKAETRAAILRELARYRAVHSLRTTRQRVAVVDTALADTAFLRLCRGMVITAVARDVLDAHLHGHWDVT